MTEVKSENTINRLTSKANPRQIERVVAGSRFGVNIVYNLSDPKEMEEDLSLLSKAMKLLQLDYLGGHGAPLPRKRPCELPELPGDPLPGDAER